MTHVLALGNSSASSVYCTLFPFRKYFSHAVFFFSKACSDVEASASSARKSVPWKFVAV